MTKAEEKYLYQRDGIWHYKRVVPKKVRHVESRSMIRFSLNTKALNIAQIRRNALIEAQDEFWMALDAEASANGGVSAATLKTQEAYYKAASARALEYGFIYKTARELVSATPVEDILDRVEKLAAQFDIKDPPPQRPTEALLGGVEKPTPSSVTVTTAYEKYVDQIAYDDQVNKSEAQRNSWEKSKRTAVKFFIEAVGDLKMDDITRAHAIQFRDWWASRMRAGDEKGARPTAYTANRRIGGMSKLYVEYYKFIGQEDRPNPFRKLRFKEDKKKGKRPPFSTDWVRSKILVPNLFDSMNNEARGILFALIETGARPSEICNLLPENICLDARVPYIQIREKDNREVKASDSNRDIPLVGISLEAFKNNPKGFPRYHDKETSFSAVANKAFKARDLFPSVKHKIYSFRHSFEDRMLEAGIDYALRCTLMGHKNERPTYGDGGSLEYRRNELLKIVHPFDKSLLDV